MIPAASRGAHLPRLALNDREWELPDGEHLIGRDLQATIRIEAAGVSRLHARVVAGGGRVTIEDLDSKNGTFRGDLRVASPQILQHGDVIGIGRRVRLVFRQGEADETESELPIVSTSGVAVFRREGDVWTLVFEGQTARLSDMKGLPDLARLLARPGVELHCLELADRPMESAAPAAMLDERARREIQGRARELQRDLDDAIARNDVAVAERAREELEQIVEILSGAFGLGGRSRGLGSDAERARTAVTWRIRNAIRKIAGVHERLGRHLTNAIRTGTFCAYEPEAPVDWQL